MKTENRKPYIGYIICLSVLALEKLKQGHHELMVSLDHRVTQHTTRTTSSTSYRVTLAVMKLCDPKQHGQGTYPKSQSADGSQFRNSSPLRTWRWKEEAMVKRCLLACSSRPAQPTFIAEPRTTCPGAAPSGLCPSASLTDHSQACHLLEDFFFFS